MTSSRRASRPRFRLLPTVLLTLAILGLPTAVYAWGRSSSSFDIHKVRVTGTQLVRKRQALRLLRREYAGDNLFTVTASDVRGALGPLCFVAAVKVDRDFPDTLTVTISEHVPAAYALAGDRWYVLDEDGFVICTTPEATEQLTGKRSKHGSSSRQSSSSDATEPTTAGVAEAAVTDNAAEATATAPTGRALRELLLAGPSQAPLLLPRIRVGGRVRERTVIGDRATKDMLLVITALPGSLRRGLAVVQEDDGELQLRFKDGPVVVWGDSERRLAKTIALRTALAAYAKADESCAWMDVSIPDRTLARPVL